MKLSEGVDPKEKVFGLVVLLSSCTAAYIQHKLVVSVTLVQYTDGLIIFPKIIDLFVPINGSS